MATTQYKKEVMIDQEKLVTYKKRSILFGLIKWEELVREDVISNDLNIFTGGTFINKLFIDGVEIDITKWELSKGEVDTSLGLNNLPTPLTSMK